MAYNGPRTWVASETPTAANFNTEVRDNITELAKSGFTVVIDGGGAPIDTASFVDVHIPYKCSIDAVYTYADTVGDITVDIWKRVSSDFGTNQPSDTDSITASTPPAISCDDYDADSTLSSWTTTLNAQDMLRFYVEACLVIERVSIGVETSRSS